MEKNKNNKTSDDFHDASSGKKSDRELNSSTQEWTTTHPQSEGKGLPAHGYGQDDLSMK